MFRKRKRKTRLPLRNASILGGEAATRFSRELSLSSGLISGLIEILSAVQSMCVIHFWDIKKTDSIEIAESQQPNPISYRL